MAPYTEFGSVGRDTADKKHEATVTESELLRIETDLQLRLPAWYRDRSLAYPFQTAGAEWMFDDPEDVIGYTRYPLENGEFDSASFKPSYVAIGESASGDLYLIDVESSDTAVLCLSHEDHSITPEWPSFEAFVEDWLTYEQTADRPSEQDEFDQWFWRRWRRVMLVIVIFAVIVPLLVIWLAHVMQQ